jgi:hypothetical protein
VKLSRQIGITTRARPVRVCYFVPASDASSEILTNVFTESYSRWGGRYTLVVPITEGRIDEAYFTWLRWFDPDILYSYCPLSDELYSHIDRLVMPRSLTVHRDTGSGSPNYRPHLERPGGFKPFRPTLSQNRRRGSAAAWFVCHRRLPVLARRRVHCGQFRYS